LQAHDGVAAFCFVGVFGIYFWLAVFQGFFQPYYIAVEFAIGGFEDFYFGGFFFVIPQPFYGILRHAQRSAAEQDGR
jgi:hypothetical protein